MTAPRQTVQRQLVLDTVRALHNHPTAQQIYEGVAEEHPSVSRATVYRNLDVLAAGGLIQRVSHLNAADRFDFNTAPHHHFHCGGCNGVFDVDIPYSEAPLHAAQSSMAEAGFAVRSHHVVFEGLCPVCAATPTTPTLTSAQRRTKIL